MNMSIDKNIRHLRKQAGWTQEELAQRLFVTRQTVSLWELGRARPDVETLEKIADCFQVELSQVLYGPEHRGDGLSRRLLIWGGASFGVGLIVNLFFVLMNWAFYRPEAYQTPMMVPFLGNLYLFLAMYGVPVLVVVSGIALGCVLLSVIRPKRTVLWAAAGLLALVLPVGYVVALSMNIPYWVLIAWDLQPRPWLFFPAGFVIGLAGGAVWKRICSGKAK